MRILVPFIILSLFTTALSTEALAQDNEDLRAINQLIDRVFELELAKDLTAQAELMAPDRVWIAPGMGRRTNQAMNMANQQAVLDRETDLVPGIQWFYDIRDRMVRFYGSGNVAVASFYLYSSFVLPAGSPMDMPEYTQQPDPTVVSYVLEKRQGAWKIVHTQFSPLFPPGS